MAANSRPLLTPKEQAKEVLRIRAMARAGASILRCDGTIEELRDYIAGSGEPGWNVTGTAKKQDLLLSVISAGRSRMIVSLSRVERVIGNSVEWCSTTDVALRPAVSWCTVMHRANLDQTRAWKSLNGSDMTTFIDALVETLRSDADVSDAEGQRQLTSCRKRSARNRFRMLEQAQGSCAGCHLNLHEYFGSRGDKGLEVHHLKPLGREKEGIIKTSLSDLVVLCATCHRLLHADPEHSLKRLQASWVRTV